MIVRSKHDRKIKGDDLCASNALSREETKGKIQIKVDGTDEKKKREANLEIKSAKVSISHPQNATGRGADNKDYVDINLVSVEEINPPSEKDKIYWRFVDNITC